jgi:hypothetical protein
VQRPQTNGICERFHATVRNECYRVAFGKKCYASLAELQADLDAWLGIYTEQRPHQGRWCYGKTPMQTFLDSVPLAKETMLATGAGAEDTNVYPTPGTGRSRVRSGTDSYTSHERRAELTAPHTRRSRNPSGANCHQTATVAARLVTPRR